MPNIIHFSDINIEDIPNVGGKNASLGEMYKTLNHMGVRIPNGFAVSAKAYRYYLEHNKLYDKISSILSDLDIHNMASLHAAGSQIRFLIRNGTMPDDLAEDIRKAYHQLEEEYGPNTDVAVRSSATAEDLPDASFAGQQETYLNIQGSQNTINACQHVFASLYTDRAISYRIDKGFDHHNIAISVGVQKMVRSDLGSSGVMFTLDTETGFRDVVFITSSYGLGENIVLGNVNPDEFYVFKPTLETKHRPILKRQRGDKNVKMIYTKDAFVGHSTRNVPVIAEDQERFSITDNEVLQLARYAVTIEKHYSKKSGNHQPMDIEWAKDGESGDLFIVQARPETVQIQSDLRIRETFHLDKSATPIVTGKSIGQKISTGTARIIYETAQMGEVKPGDILVTDITDPDWEPIMKIVSGIVTNRGGRTCHAAIIARELGIPAIVGCGNATRKITDGEQITLSCAEGDSGYIYEGELPYHKETMNLGELIEPKTKVMLNLGNPEMAFSKATLPVAGVGLARLEFIINNSIQIHPRALLEYNNLKPDVQKKIDKITAGYADRISFYIDRLAEGVGHIAAAFYPKPVIVRMSDFKSNEYASLIGGAQFEPKEENPMIGFRGASRYPSDQFADCFALECAAMIKVREEMGLDNVSLMIPFVRTIEEGKNVLESMASHGLKRGDSSTGKQGLKIYLMCEIPANALLADQFLEYFDGFSIGSNDLTQLTLGIDRDSGIISNFDERNEAVLKLMEMAIDACHRQNKYVGICGQAPSDYPEITTWLVERGIDSISLNPDAVNRMLDVILKAEEKLHTL